MSIVSGIQCDWCERVAKAKEDELREKGWRRITVMPLAAFATDHMDLCPNCADTADKALAKAKKRCQTGKRQR
jgi:uncharacterized protein YlaI